MSIGRQWEQGTEKTKSTCEFILIRKRKIARKIRLFWNFRIMVQRTMCFLDGPESFFLRHQQQTSKSKNRTGGGEGKETEKLRT
jgi:hypothetical protein